MQMGQKFSLDLTPEEAILLLTGARLLDKLVEGISIQAKDRDELIRQIISKISKHISPDLAGLSDEIAEVILESIFNSGDLEEDELARACATAEIDEVEAEEAPCNYPMYSTDRTLPTLEQALINHRTVRAHYYSFARESVDVVTLNPLALYKETGLWKMVAYCHERDEDMIFRVDRIKELIQTPRHFQAPADSLTYSHLPFAS